MPKVPIKIPMPKHTEEHKRRKKQTQKLYYDFKKQHHMIKDSIALEAAAKIVTDHPKDIELQQEKLDQLVNQVLIENGYKDFAAWFLRERTWYKDKRK